MDNTQESGIVSAIWILASNDESSFTLYESVRHRLGLSKTEEVKDLIKKYPELFRVNIPKGAMETWKKDMLDGNRRPSYIINIEKVDERNKIIESLTFEDGFRTQFRTEATSPRSDITIINWGLEHIERSRKINLEVSEQKSIWKKEILIPVLSIIIALLTLILTSYWQYQNIQTQKQMKEYELSFKPKQEGYSMFMKAVKNSYISAVENSKVPIQVRNTLKIQNDVEQIGLAYYSIEPFLNESSRIAIWNKYQEYGMLLNDINEQKEKPSEIQIEQTADKVIAFQTYFRENLYKELFEK